MRRFSPQRDETVFRAAAAGAGRERRWAGRRIVVLLLLPLAAAAAGGCGPSQRDYDRLFPPGSTRQQMRERFGPPAWTVTRPAEKPTDEQWLKAIDGDDHRWMHPSVFLRQIAEVESATKSKVASFDALVVPQNRSLLQRLDVFQAYTDLVFYDAAERVLSSRPLEYYAYGD